MPVRTVSSPVFASVIESVGGGQAAGDAKTKSATSVSADTDVVALANGGANCTVQLDFTISKHEIFYGDNKTADSQSDKESRTVRVHEYAHVGARNALASKTLLEALCKEVGVNWKFSIKSTGDTAADQATLDATKATYESAVEDFITPLIDYLDELVVHETQRNAGKVGMTTDSQLATQLAAISYTDPATGTAKSPSTSITTPGSGLRHS